MDGVDTVWIINGPDLAPINSTHPVRLLTLTISFDRSLFSTSTDLLEVSGPDASTFEQEVAIKLGNRTPSNMNENLH